MGSQQMTIVCVGGQAEAEESRNARWRPRRGARQPEDHSREASMLCTACEVCRWAAALMRKQQAARFSIPAVGGVVWLLRRTAGR